MCVTEKFGRRLKYYRTRRKLSQENLAEISGLHRTYISGLERGIRNPTIKIVVQLARALEIDPGALLSDSCEP